MRMISESHASNSSPLVYTCSAQPSGFHCMKGYRQLAYDSSPYDSSPSPGYPSIKQEPIDYTTCENPYDQGMLEKDGEKAFSLQFLNVHSINQRRVSSSFSYYFWLVTNFYALLHPRDNKIKPVFFSVNLIFSSLEMYTCWKKHFCWSVSHFYLIFSPTDKCKDNFKAMTS